MEKQKDGNLGLENGVTIPNNFVESSKTLTATKDTVVTLANPGKGCYFSRVQVAVFTAAFFLTILTVVLLLSFVRKEQIIHITNKNENCSCINKSDLIHKINITKSDEEYKNASNSLTAENLTQAENISVDTEKTESDKETEKYPWDEIRLPRNLIPKHYDIELDVDLESRTFLGEVHMTLSANSSTNLIMFHRNNLRINIENVRVRQASDNSEIGISKQFMVPKNQFHVLQLEMDLHAGMDYVVHIWNYTGKIIQDLRGLYLSSYITTEGQVRYLAATQLQSTDARKVFPCMDEPDMKATYKVTIIHNTEYTALNNMPVEREQYLSSNRLRVTFHKTPKMSTYLLAIVISDFEYKERIFDDGYQLRVWSQPNKINQTAYALDTAERIYHFFIDYFAISDVVTKADHVAVPDFSGGAMENWGLVIYRETALLYDPEVSSTQNQLMVTLIVAHEIAHTWFGNMVTMKWWDDLWLNEGFASLLMYFAMDHINPDWNVFTLNVVVKEVFTVMVKDALTTSHPVSNAIRTPDDIAQFFDTISYSKGMAVLRMLLEFVGWEDFRSGLQKYVTRYKFKNAEMDELWETFSEAVNYRFDIKAIMDTWTRQMGYPVVTMRSEGDRYILTQERFLLDCNNSVNDSMFGYKWRIPFTYMTKDIPINNSALVWLNMGEASIPKVHDTWIIGNVKYVGFYRVNYELDMWRQLAEQLNTNHLVFHEANRAGLIGDSFNLARAGILDYDVALNMTTYLNNEELYVPWKAFLDSIEFIRGMLSKQGAYVLLQKYLHDLVAPVFDRVGTAASDNLPERYLRQIILTTACDVGVKKAVKFAKHLFTRWKDDGVPVPTLYSMVVYSVGVREGSVEEWDYVWNKSLTTNVAAEREMLLEALAHTQKPWLLWRYANWIFDGHKIKLQDVRLVVSYFAKTPLGRMIALHLLMNKWDKLNEQFGQDTFLLRETISEVTQFVNTEFELNQLATLFRDKPPQVARKEAANALELIRANIKWMETNYDIISDWLRAHVVGML